LYNNNNNNNNNNLTAGSLSVVSYALEHSVHSTCSAAKATVKREQLIGLARHENCNIHTVSMTWPHLPVDRRARLYRIATKHTLKHFIHLRSSSKRITARFADVKFSKVARKPKSKY